MAHSVWSGSLSFGLVNVPVDLFPATEDHTVHFHQLEAGTADRIRMRRVNERTGEEVALSDIVKGYDLGGGEYVVVTPEELSSVAPAKSSSIEISDFVDLAEIDPVHFRSTYYVVPSSEGAVKAYRLLSRAMEETSQAGVALFVMRGKEYLCTVRARDGVLLLATMYFADEIRPPAAVFDDSGAGTTQDGLRSVRITKRDKDMATTLISSLSTAWDPGAFRDTFRREVTDLVERKRKGRSVVVAEEPGDQAGAPVIDLTEALEASVRRARAGARGGTKRRRSAPKGSRGKGTVSRRSEAPKSRTTKRAGTRPKAS